MRRRTVRLLLASGGLAIGVAGFAVDDAAAQHARLQTGFPTVRVATLDTAALQGVTEGARAAAAARLLPATLSAASAALALPPADRALGRTPAVDPVPMLELAQFEWLTETKTRSSKARSKGSSKSPASSKTAKDDKKGDKASKGAKKPTPAPGSPAIAAGNAPASKAENSKASDSKSVDSKLTDSKSAGAAAGAAAAAAPAAASPQASPQASGTWPKTLDDAREEAARKADPDPASWPSNEIEIAKARCTALLKGLDVVTIPEPAMRQGDCGAPAPVRLVSIGRNPEVALSPPPVMTCDMVAALHTWLQSDLQRLAKKHLGATIIKIETMSDYSCRNAYGRTKSRLSEHGRANALDIRGFVTAKGERTLLLADWGLTARDIAQQVAAARAKAEAQRVAQEKAAAALAAKTSAKGKDNGRPSGASDTPAGAPSQPSVAAGQQDAVPRLGFRDGGATLIEGLPRVRVTVPGRTSGDDGDRRMGTGLSVEPNRLGGPDAKTTLAAKAAKNAKSAVDTPSPTVSSEAPPSKGKMVYAPASAQDQVSAKARFLREAHATACKIFGTTLGPEANNAHRNHFHVDMAERKRSNFCQ